ncbi:MAG: hypothetical protein ACJ8DZ_12075 [Allosphingosinicella sp.]
MATNDNVTRKPSNERRLGLWSAPVVKRLAAGSAENGSGPVSDDPVDLS